MELDVEVHSSAGSSQTGSSNYATAGNGTNPIDNTPTNAEMSLLKKACDDQRGDDEDDLESLYPSVPLRTSSILPRPAMVCKVKSILNLIFRYQIFQIFCFNTIRTLISTAKVGFRKSLSFGAT